MFFGGVVGFCEPWPSISEGGRDFQVQSMLRRQTEKKVMSFWVGGMLPKFLGSVWGIEASGVG